jgi:uncharacterized protein (TIGR03545 family)
MILIKASGVSKMIRKNGAIAAAIIVVIVIVFDIFFLDWTVKALITSTGSKMARAKVEISSLHVDLLNSKISIKNLQVADKSKEYKNLFSADELTADFMLIPLLENKYIVDNISVVNLSAGGDRKTSGFLPVSQLKKIDKEETDNKNSALGKMQTALMQKGESEVKKMPVSKLGDLKNMKNFDFKKMVKKEDLASYRAVKAASDGIKSQKEKTEAVIKAVDAEKRIKSTKESIAKIKSVKINGVADIPAAKDALTELDKIKNDSESVIKSADEAKKQAALFYEYSKDAYKAIDEAKQKDYNALLEKVDIKMVDAASIEKALVGNMWYDRAQKIIYYMSLAEKYIPKKKKKDKDSLFVKKRGAGREIVYSSNGRYPGFWIKKVLLSVKGNDKGNSYYMKGEILDIAAEQDVTGKPLVINLELDNPSQEISINGVINHMESIDDKLTVSVKNLPASFIGLDKTDFGKSRIDSAKVALQATAHNAGDDFTITGSINVNNINVVTTDKDDIAYLAIKGIDSLNIMFKAKQAETFSMEVSSNVYDKIKKSLASIYGSKLEKAKNDAKQAVEDAIKGDMKDLTGTSDSADKSIGTSVSAIKSQSDSLNSDIDRAKTEINNKIAGAGGKNLLKGLFR